MPYCEHPIYKWLVVRFSKAHKIRTKNILQKKEEICEQIIQIFFIRTAKSFSKDEPFIYYLILSLVMFLQCS